MTEELFLDKKREKIFFCLAHNVYLWISIDLSTAKSRFLACHGQADRITMLMSAQRKTRWKLPWRHFGKSGFARCTLHGITKVVCSRCNLAASTMSMAL